MSTTHRERVRRVVDPDERASTAELLIAEARARARRRRTAYTVLALVIVGCLALAARVVEGDATASSELPTGAVDAAAAVVTGSSCLPPGELPQVPDPLIGGAGSGAQIAMSSTVDATSDGAPCKLVLRYWFHRFGDGSGLFMSGKVWLFSDGRIIVDTDRDGFVSWERRLTPDGVERVRTHAVSALGAAITPSEAPQDLPMATIHYGDRIYHPRDPDQFVRQFVDLFWLPASAWTDLKQVEYVPPWYVACYESLSPRLEPSAVLDLMTPQARQVLRSKTTSNRSWWERTTPCVILDNRESQLIFGEFASAGITRETQVEQASMRTFTFGTAEARGQVTFFGLMPNGEMVLHGD